MKYSWKIKLIVNSFEVGMELLHGNDNTFNAIACSNERGASQLFFRLRDVSAMEISPL